MIAPGDEADIAAWVVRSYPERGDAAFVVHTDTNTGEASGFFQGLKAYFASRPFVRDIGSAIADARGEAAVSIAVQEAAKELWEERGEQFLRDMYVAHDDGRTPFGSKPGVVLGWLWKNAPELLGRPVYDPLDRRVASLGDLLADYKARGLASNQVHAELVHDGSIHSVVGESELASLYAKTSPKVFGGVMGDAGGRGVMGHGQAEGLHREWAQKHRRRHEVITARDAASVVARTNHEHAQRAHELAAQTMSVGDQRRAWQASVRAGASYQHERESEEAYAHLSALGNDADLRVRHGQAEIPVGPSDLYKTRTLVRLPDGVMVPWEAELSDAGNWWISVPRDVGRQEALGMLDQVWNPKGYYHDPSLDDETADGGFLFVYTNTADLNDEGGESDTAKVREMLVVTRPDLVPVFDRNLAAVEGLMETIRAEVEVGEEPPRTDSEQALGILHVQRKLDALDRREPPSGAAGRIDPGPRTSAPEGVDYGRDDDGIPRRVSSAPRTSVQPAPAQPVSWDSKPTPHGREVKHPDTYLNFLFHLGWYTTKKTPSASNQYVMERYDLRNSLSGLTGEVVLLREEKGRYDWSPERIYDIRLPEGWQAANAAAVEARRSLFSWDVEDPKPKHVALINLVQGDIVLGVYASEIRVWRVTHEGKRAQIANSNTMRRMGRVVTAHHQDVPGGPRSASSELTPAAVDKNPTIVQTDLGKVGIQVPDGTRVFWQVRSTADNDTFNFIGRAGVAKVVRTAAETQEDPWAVPLTAGEIVEAGNLWREVEAASGWDWLPNVCAKVAGDQTGAMSVALGEVLRANGVHAEMRTGSGTVSGTIEIKFREGEKAKVAKILDPDTLFSDSASFKAHVARGNESDSSTDYYSPGGAKLNLSYAADFLRRYVVAVHNLSKRSKYGYQYDKPTVLGRYLWQQHLATRAEREPSGEAGAESGARPTPGRGERKASWSSPKYGTVTIIEGAEGRRDTWNNIKAGGKRYGYNGSRWAKSDVPPADLLAEVAENGWGEMFGVSG